MGVMQTIWLSQGTRKNLIKYHYYESFDTKKEAQLMARFHNKENKSKTQIIKYEKGKLFPYTQYALYVNNIQTLKP